MNELSQARSEKRRLLRAPPRWSRRSTLWDPTALSQTIRLSSRSST